VRLLIQNINIAIFICVILPMFFIAIVYFLVFVSDSAIQELHVNGLIVFKELLYNFVFENKLFHSSVTLIGITFLILLVLFHLKTRIKLNNDELNLAAYILAKTKKYDVLNYQTLNKELEFRNLTLDQINMVALTLERFKHVNIAHNTAIELTAMIRESEW